jgi:pyridoxine 5-phosphate synthase
MRLGVNVDHVATVRQARRGLIPDPVEAALVCERSGADSIVCHLREDRRHIQDRDVRRLRATVTTRLNLEMSAAEEIVRVALLVKPHQVTLVPERRHELTTEGGLDVVKLSTRLQVVTRRLTGAGISVSLFIDPVTSQVRAAKQTGATTIELHTGRYANARTSSTRNRELTALRKAAEQGRALGLTVAAGHGLDYGNTAPLLDTPEIEELNIGYAIIVRALSVGLEQAVREMAGLVHQRTPHAASALQPT